MEATIKLSPEELNTLIHGFAFYIDEYNLYGMDAAELLKKLRDKQEYIWAKNAKVKIK